MVQEHHNSGGGGRYYKEDSSRRSRKYYSSPHSYNSYSSYSANPNPFPPSSSSPQIQHQQTVSQSQPQSTQSNPFSSRRNDSLNSPANPEVQQPQSFSPSAPSSSSSSSYPSRNPSNSNGNWYHMSQSKRPNTYRSNRPSGSGVTASNPSRRNISGGYREDLIPQQNSRYSDYNGYIDTYQHDHYSNSPSHKKSSFNKSRYSGQFPAYSKNGGSNSNADYKDFQPYRQGYNTSTSGKQSLMDSKTPTIDHSNFKLEKSSSLEPPRTDSEDHDTSDLIDNLEKSMPSTSEKPSNYVSSDEHDNEQNQAAEDIRTNSNLDVAEPNEKIVEEKSQQNATPDKFEVDSTHKNEYEPRVEKSIESEAINGIPNEYSGFGKSSNNAADTDVIKAKPIISTEKELTLSSEVCEAVKSPEDLESNIKQEETVSSNVVSRPKEHLPKELTDSKDESSDEEYSETEGCIFPMLESQYRAWVLKHKSKSERRKNLVYLNKSRLRSLSQYNFLDKSFLIFKQADAFILFNVLKENAALIENKKEKLTEHYVYSNNLWRKDVAFYDKQLEKAYENDSDNARKPKIEEANSSKSTSSRRSRHHGDSVRTEAEFMEILASLEQERERDPLIRAQYGAATIPDMIMDPIEKYAMTRKMDSNNLITNKDVWARRILTDPIDTFTEAEHTKFCELYTLYPKKFGRISHELGGLRSAEECVLHYYKTKKTTNYKQLLANKNKKSKKKSSKKKKESKSRTDAATPDTSNVENEISVDNSGSPDLVNATDAQAQGEVSVKVEDHKRKVEDLDLPANKQRKVSETTSIPVTSFSGNEILTDSKLDQTINDESEIKIEDQSNADMSSTLSHVSGVNESLEGHHKSDNELDRTTHIMDEANGKIKRHKKKDEEKPHISSYWSVQDINNFPILLEKFGSRWEEIAEELGTKSATMVKNYYQRGLVEHPNWQSFLAINRPPRQTILPSDNHDHNTVQSESQRRPSMGYFYKPASSYAANYPAIHQMLPMGQPQPVSMAMHDDNDVNRLQQVPHFVPIAQTAPLYSPYVTEINPVTNRPPPPPQGPMPVMAARNGIMNMSSLLNANSASPNQFPPPPPQQSNMQLPPLNVQYAPVRPITPQFPISNRGPSIMNLLNNDDVQPANTSESANNNLRTTRTTPFKPNISNIMNSPVKVEAPPPGSSVSVYQQQQQQQQQSYQPQSQPKPAAFTGGTSALDALARIAFERK